MMPRMFQIKLPAGLELLKLLPVARRWVTAEIGEQAIPLLAERLDATPHGSDKWPGGPDKLPDGLP